MSLPQFKNLRIPPTAFWTHDPAPYSEDDPEGHRIFKYHPSNTTDSAASTRTLLRRYTVRDPSTQKCDPHFTWARILLTAQEAVEQKYKHLADNRLDRDFNDIGSSRKIQDLGRGSAARYLAVGIRDYIELLYESSILRVELPDEKPESEAEIRDVVTKGSTYGALASKHANWPRELWESEEKRRMFRDGGIRPEMRWLEAFKVSVGMGINGIRAAELWAKSGSGERVLAKGIASAVSTIPEMTRLVAFLMEREDTFHRVLAQEHIFGHLNDKRINLLSGHNLCELFQYFLIDADDRDDMFADGVSPLQLFPARPGGQVFSDIYDETERIYRDMHNFQIEMRKRFSWNKLVEWTYKPLWEQIYVTVNPELGISDATINEFLAWSNTNNTTSNMIGVLPILPGRLGDEQCVACFNSLHMTSDETTPIYGSYVIMLKCHHLFHADCIQRHWDQPNRYSNMCMTCRHPAGPLKDLAPDAEIGTNDIDFSAEHGLSGLSDAWRGQMQEWVREIMSGSREKSLTDASEQGADFYWKHYLSTYLARKRILEWLRSEM